MRTLSTAARGLRARLNLRSTLPAYLMLTTGGLLMAVANDLFLIPNNVISGGLSGICVILYRTIGTPVGTMYLVLNIPLLLAGWRWLGGLRFVARTLYTVLVFSLTLDYLAPFIKPVTSDPLLYTLYGGIMFGSGMGLIFRAYGTSGGSDIVVQILNRLRGIAVSQALVGFDLFVLALAAYFFGADKALYALIVSFTSSRAVAAVQEGFSSTRLIWIISNEPEQLAQRIIHDLHRGVTFLDGTGAYTGSAYRVIMAAVRQPQLNQLVDLIRQIDPAAFVIIGEARQVLGFGFQPFPQPLGGPTRPRIQDDTGPIPIVGR